MHRWMLLGALALGLLGCESAPEEKAPSEGVKKPSAPIPTTPPHRKPLPPGDIKKIEGLVAAQLAKQHPELSKKCWPGGDAAAAGSAKPAAKPKVKSVKEMMASSIEITYQMIYDADGKQISRVLLENPTAKNRELHACLKKLETETKIPAAGRKVQIKVPLTFP